MLRAAAALLTLAALLVGVPGALIAWGQTGLLLELRPDHLLNPTDGRPLLALLSLVGWVAWVAVLLTTTGELLRVVSHGRVSIRVPGTGWLRPLVAGLVAAALAPMMTARAATPEPPTPVPVSTTEQAPPAQTPEPSPQTAAPLLTADAIPYVIQQGDELWTLAEEHLGSGMRWRDIVQLNPHISPNTQLVPGEVLLLPADATLPQDRPTPESGSTTPASPRPNVPTTPESRPAEEPPETTREPRPSMETAPEATPTPTSRTVVVKDGDTLWDLAAEHLGDPERWPEIYRANRDQIADPDLIDAGWELVIPAAADASRQTDTLGTLPTPAETDTLETLPTPPQTDTLETLPTPPQTDTLETLPTPPQTDTLETLPTPPQTDTLETLPTPPETDTLETLPTPPETDTLETLPASPGALEPSATVTPAPEDLPDSGSELPSAGATPAPSSENTSPSVPSPGATTPALPVSPDPPSTDQAAPEATTLPAPRATTSTHPAPRTTASAVPSPGVTTPAAPVPRATTSTDPLPEASSTVPAPEASTSEAVPVQTRHPEVPLPDSGVGQELGDQTSEHDSGPALEVLGPLGGLLAAALVVGVGVRRRTQLLQRAVGQRIVPVDAQTARFWTALNRQAQELPSPVASPEPTSVVLGWIDEEDVAITLEEKRCTLLTGERELTDGAVAAALTGLVCAPWSQTVNVVVVGSEDAWEACLDEPRVSELDTTAEGLTALQRICSERRISIGEGTLAAVRANDDLRSAFAPTVFLFATPLKPAEAHRILDCLDLGPVGVSVLAAAPAGASLDGTHVVALQEGSATMPGSSAFTPQLLSAPARRAVISLFGAATTDVTEPAPWWASSELPSNVSVLSRSPKDFDMTDPPEPQHPTVYLLGPVELRAARGTPPTRATVQCIEYCTWLLEHPDATPSQMTGDLLVAEGTRRSNMSRLRAWLGADDEGQLYLPEAYSGRINLTDDVSSDWEQFQTLLGGGVNHASPLLLKEALSLVRGAPLENVAFQWPWCDDLRRDMVSMITDAAAVLADRCLDQRDPEGALWAVAQGQLAAAEEEEVLTAREVQALAMRGDRTAVERRVRQLTRSARAAGRDLQEDTARRIQQALHLSRTVDSPGQPS